MLRLLSLPSALLAAGLAAAVAMASCGRAHDLGVTGASSSAGSGGAGGVPSGSGGSGGSGGGGGELVASTAAAASSSSGTGGQAPTGPTKLTVVNGINDYPAVRFCFLPGDTPWPAATTGLPFAGSQVVSPISSAIPAGMDVTPWAVAGDLAQTAGMTCTQMLALAASGTDAGPPPVVASALAVIPAMVFESHLSVLVVATGCLGGAGHDNPNGTTACGAGYSSTSPTAGMVAVSMSQIADPAHVSLQVVNAALALPTSDVGVLPAKVMAMDTTVVGSLTEGAIGPTPPFAMLGVNDFGAPGAVKVSTFSPGTMSMTSQVALSTVFANGGVGVAGFANGAGLVLVAVGAGPGLPTSSFWHALTYVLVEGNPG